MAIQQVTANGYKHMYLPLETNSRLSLDTSEEPRVGLRGCLLLGGLKGSSL